MLCDYKDIFGKPGEGIHKYRVFDIAIVDTLFVIIVAVLIAAYSGIPLFIVMIVLFLLGIVVHAAFCVETGLAKKLKQI